MDSITVGIAAIIGIVEGIRRLLKSDWRTVLTIAMSGALGAVFQEVMGIELVNFTQPGWLNGLLSGLGASGIITAMSHFGRKSTNVEGGAE